MLDYHSYMTNIRGQILIVKLFYYTRNHSRISILKQKKIYQTIVLKSFVDKNQNSNKIIRYQVNERINSWNCIFAVTHTFDIVGHMRLTHPLDIKSNCEILWMPNSIKAMMHSSGSSVRIERATYQATHNGEQNCQRSLWKAQN